MAQSTGTCSLCGRAITDTDEQEMFVDGGHVSMRLCGKCLDDTARANLLGALAAAVKRDEVEIGISSAGPGRYSVKVRKGARACEITNIRASILENDGDPKLARIIAEIAAFIEPPRSWSDED